MRVKESRVMKAGSLYRQRQVRRWHRVVAMATSCQLLLWTLSGLYFAFIDIDYVRGHQFKRAAESSQIDLSLLQVGGISASKLVIIERRPNEIVLGVHHDDKIEWRDDEGRPLEPLSSDEALTVGSAGTVMSLDRFEWVDSEVAGSEYRGAPLPLWRLWESANPDRVVYLDAMSGEVVVVRHEAWRWWDFLWSLHIMSYDDRDTIGTWLLRIFSVLALATAILGLWLFRDTRRAKRGSVEQQHP